MLPKRASPSPSNDDDSIPASFTSLLPKSTSNVGSSPTPTTLPAIPGGNEDNDSNDNDNDGDGSETANNLVNMYFLILAAFAVLLLFGLWYWRRGKKLKRIASLGRRRDALEQDLELGGRRSERSEWLGGMNLPGIRGGARREEGVDERGEAPPPYSAATTTEARTPGVDLAVPPGAHVRDGGPGLPKYEELGREEHLARTPEGELVVVRERELLRESSTPGTEDPRTTSATMADELAREHNVVPNPRAEEEDSGGGAKLPSDAGTLEATVGGETVRATGTDRA